MKKTSRPSRQQEEKVNVPLEESPPKTETTVSTPADIVKDEIKGAPVAIAVQDCWRYHLDQTPRIFRKGEIIPEGWTDDAAVRKLWACDPFGQFTKVKG